MESKRKRHKMTITVAFDRPLNEREALEATKSLVGKMKGQVAFKSKIANVKVDTTAQAEVVSLGKMP